MTTLIWTLYTIQLIISIIAMVQYHKLYLYREQNNIDDSEES
jgi:hypothetical protein